MADDLNPRFTGVGADINIKAAEMVMSVNDVPVFNPAEVFGGAAEVDTTLRMNPAFRKGRNSVVIGLRFLPDASTGYDPYFRLDFGHWDIREFPDSFDGRPMAVRMQVTPSETGEHVLRQAVEPQPRIAANEPARIAPPGPPQEGWVWYRFDVEVEVDLPPMAWMEGELLSDTAETRQTLSAAMRQVHSNLGDGAAAARMVLEPFIARQAASLGGTPDEYFPVYMAPDLDNEDLQLVPFDVSGAELRFFGEGRLATFVPMPHRFEDAATPGYVITQFFYYWRDTDGQWNLIH